MAIIELRFAALRFAAMTWALFQLGTLGKADDDKSEVDVAARESVERWLDGLMKGQAVEPKIVAIDGVTERFFPDDRFYAVRFMRYPRAVKPPHPLKLENLVRVRPDGTVERIADIEALEKLFKSKLSAVQVEDDARAVLRDLLRLAEEFYQDGEYTFEIPSDSVSVTQKGDGFVVSGKSVVIKGGRGEIEASVAIDDPSRIEIHGKVRPDVRLR